MFSLRPVSIMIVNKTVTRLALQHFMLLKSVRLRTVFCTILNITFLLRSRRLCSAACGEAPKTMDRFVEMFATGRGMQHIGSISSE